MSLSLKKFDRWFVAPIQLLKALSGGDGAFVALSVSFSLFERYVKSDLKRRKVVADSENFFIEASLVTGVEPDLLKKFWGMFRDGMQHYLQPKTFTSNGIYYGWAFGESFPALPYYVVNTETDRTIALNPWKWTEFVVSLYEKDPGILEIMESHAFGGLYTYGSGKASPLVEFAILPMFLCPLAERSADNAVPSDTTSENT